MKPLSSKAQTRRPANGAGRLVFMCTALDLFIGPCGSRGGVEVTNSQAGLLHVRSLFLWGGGSGFSPLANQNESKWKESFHCNKLHVQKGNLRT